MEDITPSVDAELAAALPVVVEHQVGVEEVDAATVDRLARELDAVRLVVEGMVTRPCTAVVVLDLDRVRLLSAAGLRCLVTTAMALDRHGHRLLVTNPSPVVARVLDLEPPGLLR